MGEIPQAIDQRAISADFRQPVLYAHDGRLLPSSNGYTTETRIAVEPERRPIRNLIFASWRLPEEERNGVRVKMTGGLAHAAMDFFHDANGSTAHTLTWVGCLGEGEGNEPMPFPAAFGDDKTNGVIIDGFTMGETLIKNGYLDKSNGEQWFLHHMDDENLTLHPDLADDHREFGRRFAERIALHDPTPADFIWNQDYQLPYAGEELRKLMGDVGEKLRIGIHWHIPWANIDFFGKLPDAERQALLGAMLSHNNIGFQTKPHKDNFIACVEEFLCKNPNVPEDEKPEIAELPDRHIVKYKGRAVTVKDYAISISPSGVREQAATEEALKEKEETEKRFSGLKLAFQMSRDDPNKRHKELIAAARNMWRDHPEMLDDTAISAVLAKGRDLPAYRRYSAETAQLIEDTNKEFQQHGTVVFVDGQMSRERIMGRMSAEPHYVFTMNSIQEGMGLTPKEAAIVAPEHTVFALGKQTGAYQELGPYVLGIEDGRNIDTLAETLYEAFTMPLQQRIEMRQGLRTFVEQHPINKWFVDWMTDATAA